MQMGLVLLCSNEVVWISDGSAQEDHGSYVLPQSKYQRNFIPNTIFIWESCLREPISLLTRLLCLSGAYLGQSSAMKCS